MKQIISLFLLLVLIGCTKDNSPTGPTEPVAPTITPTYPPPAPSGYDFDFTGYGEALDPSYIKVYSDGSWNKYAGTETVNGTTYVVLLAENNSRYYYTVTTGQYAGYKPSGENPVIFNSPQPLMPTRWHWNTAVVLTTNFTYQGYSVVAKISYTLLDTTPVATVLGSFSPVAHFFVKVDITASSGDASSTSQDIWVARGPGGIKSRPSGGNPVEFAHGYVNGRSWGSTPGAQKVALRSISYAERFLQGIVR